MAAEQSKDIIDEVSSSIEVREMLGFVNVSNWC